MKKLFWILFLGVSAAFGRVSEEVWSSVQEAALQPGDLVFIRTGGPLFGRVADISGSWCSHVGIIVEQRDGQWMVAESKVPVVRQTPLRAFLDRSEKGVFEIRRLGRPLSRPECVRLECFAASQKGRFYDTGFNLASARRTFCSKFAREALYEATGEWVGTDETFAQLLSRNTKTTLWFWRLWYFGNIPWERKTITPASLLESPKLQTVLTSIAKNA